MADLQHLLQHLMEQRGSDLHVKVGSPPHVRVDGHLKASPLEPMVPAEVEQMALDILPKERANEFGETGEADFAYSVPGLGRFRVNVYRQRGSVAMVFRRVAPGIPPWEALGLPPSVCRMADDSRGLVLITGPTGSGKTTTVAAMIDHINETRAAHIVTIEDPIEFLHPDKKSIVSQREVGSDTHDFAEALRRAQRQDPDVIFVGELPDADTVSGAISAAATGQLVVSTMQTATVSETINRLVDFFPPFQQKQARHSLAAALRGVVSQRLLERADGRGRTPAVEVLVGTTKVFDAVCDPDAAVGIDRLIAEGEYHGMQTFDQALFSLYKDGLVGLRDALAVATHPEDLRIALQQAGLSTAY